MINMQKYKNIISDFFDELDAESKHGLNSKKERQKLSKRDSYLLTLLFSCRNKLAEIFNCIDDNNWELPVAFLDITPSLDTTPTLDDTIDNLNDKLYFTCNSDCSECHKKCEDCEYYSISYKDFQKAISELKENKNDIR